MKILLLLLIFQSFSSCSNHKGLENKLNSMSEKKPTLNTKFEISHIENNFTQLNLEDFGRIGGQAIAAKDSNSIPLEVIASKFLEPINQLEYSRSFIRNGYYAGYKYKVNDSIFILSCMKTSDCFDYEVDWTLFNVKSQLVISKIVVDCWNSDSEFSLREFDGNRISLYMKYKRHFLNGFEGDNSTPIEQVKHYIIVQNRFVEED
jgi:hypothetical protein